MPKKTMSARGVWECQLTEEHVIKAIRQFLELNGAKVFRVVERIPWGRRKSEPGIPDLFGWFPGTKAVLVDEDQKVIEEPFSFYAKPFFIEVKKPGGKRRPAQEAWIQAANRDGVIAFFAESVDDVIKGFWEYGINLKGEL